MFKRKIYDKLVRWKNESDGETAVLIDGARRVGKSSRYATHASLDKFRAKFGDRLGESFPLYTKDLQVKDGIVHLPIYMAMFL